MAPMIRTRSSSWSGWVAKIIFAFRVRARLRSEARTRRESKIRFGAGKKNLHILKTDTRPLQVRSSFRIGNTRMFFSSMMPSASAAVACGGTPMTLVCITSRTFGATSATNRGGGAPKVFRTKSIRSFVSPQRAATALGIPVRRLNSA